MTTAASMLSPLQQELEIALLEQVQPWMEAHLQAHPNANGFDMLSDLGRVLVGVMRSTAAGRLEHAGGEEIPPHLLVSAFAAPALAKAIEDVCQAHWNDFIAAGSKQ